jgi:hypothetical protein
MRMRLVLAMTLTASALALGTVGCGLVGQSKPAMAQEAALELNLNARFGRMELAAERVAPKARDQFFDRRRAWGGSVRIADYDMTGLKMKGEDDAETYVKIAWYRANEGDLRVTTLKQKWHSDAKGDWKLTEEQRLDGDLGLLGEPPVPVSVVGEQPKRSQFPTIYLGGGAGDAPPPAAPAAPAAPQTAAPAMPAPVGFGEDAPVGALRNR